MSYLFEFTSEDESEIVSRLEGYLLKELSVEFPQLLEAVEKSPLQFSQEECTVITDLNAQEHTSRDGNSKNCNLSKDDNCQEIDKLGESEKKVCADLEELKHEKTKGSGSENTRPGNLFFSKNQQWTEPGMLSKVLILTMLWIVLFFLYLFLA